MNQDQVMSLARWGLTVAGTYVVSSGKVDNATWAQISGGLAAIVPVVWSMFVHSAPAKS